LLFAKGKRPSIAAIREFAEANDAVSISHDPERLPRPGLSDAASPDGANLLELVRAGLTFDVAGLSPGAHAGWTAPDVAMDLEKVPNSFTHESIRLMPGQHLAGGARAMPIMQGLMAIARDLVLGFGGIEAVVWGPAKCAIGPKYFESIISDWLSGGPFPALGLVSFHETIDGGLQSTGLDYWTGQELRIEPPLVDDKVAATRLGVRLVDHLVHAGKLQSPERMIAQDGTSLVLNPSSNRRFVRVAIE